MLFYKFYGNIRNRKDLGLLGLYYFAVAAPAEYFTVFHCKFSTFLWANKISDFPPASFLFVSPIFPYDLLEACKSSMVMIVSFTLTSSVCPHKRFLYNIFRKLVHRDSSTMNKPIFSILLKLTQSSSVVPKFCSTLIR